MFVIASNEVAINSNDIVAAYGDKVKLKSGETLSFDEETVRYIINGLAMQKKSVTDIMLCLKKAYKEADDKCMFEANGYRNGIKYAAQILGLNIIDWFE